jgi:hypothetical protein
MGIKYTTGVCSSCCYDGNAKVGRTVAVKYAIGFSQRSKGGSTGETEFTPCTARIYHTASYDNGYEYENIETGNYTDRTSSKGNSFFCAKGTPTNYVRTICGSPNAFQVPYTFKDWETLTLSSGATQKGGVTDNGGGSTSSWTSGCSTYSKGTAFANFDQTFSNSTDFENDGGTQATGGTTTRSGSTSYSGETDFSQEDGVTCTCWVGTLTKDEGSRYLNAIVSAYASLITITQDFLSTDITNTNFDTSGFIIRHYSEATTTRGPVENSEATTWVNQTTDVTYYETYTTETEWTETTETEFTTTTETETTVYTTTDAQTDSESFSPNGELVEYQTTVIDNTTTNTTTKLITDGTKETTVDGGTTETTSASKTNKETTTYETSQATITEISDTTTSKFTWSQEDVTWEPDLCLYAGFVESCQTYGREEWIGNAAGGNSSGLSGYEAAYSTQHAFEVTGRYTFFATGNENEENGVEGKVECGVSSVVQAHDSDLIIDLITAKIPEASTSIFQIDDILSVKPEDKTSFCLQNNLTYVNQQVVDAPDPDVVYPTGLHEVSWVTFADYTTGTSLNSLGNEVNWAGISTSVWTTDSLYETGDPFETGHVLQAEDRVQKFITQAGPALTKYFTATRAIKTLTTRCHMLPVFRTTEYDTGGVENYSYTHTFGWKTYEQKTVSVTMTTGKVVINDQLKQIKLQDDDGQTIISRATNFGTVLVPVSTINVNNYNNYEVPITPDIILANDFPFEYDNQLCTDLRNVGGFPNVNGFFEGEGACIIEYKPNEAGTITAVYDPDFPVGLVGFGENITGLEEGPDERRAWACVTSKSEGKTFDKSQSLNLDPFNINSAAKGIGDRASIFFTDGCVQDENFGAQEGTTYWYNTNTGEDDEQVIFDTSTLIKARYSTEIDTVIDGEQTTSAEYAEAIYTVGLDLEYYDDLDEIILPATSYRRGVWTIRPTEKDVSYTVPAGEYLASQYDENNQLIQTGVFTTENDANFTLEDAYTKRRAISRKNLKFVGRIPWEYQANLGIVFTNRYRFETGVAKFPKYIIDHVYTTVRDPRFVFSVDKFGWQRGTNENCDSSV